MTRESRTPVVFVGAGPGDPDLITVAGRRALEQADIVVYAGSLVPETMLGWCSNETEKINSAGLNLDQIVRFLADGYQNGRRVVRLHTGDPSLYGAINEQFARLRELEVPYRIIPGVTAAFAAAAALGMEYTLPEQCQTLILTRTAGRTPVPETEGLAGLAAHRSSIVIYLSAGQAEKVAAELAPHYGLEAAVAVVYRASWPDEKIIRTTVGNLARDMDRADVNRQALIIVGPAVAAMAQDGPAAESKLYAPAFSHGYRQGGDE